MILYNIRKRGPYEYDKFILNTFQLTNEVKRMERNIEENDTSELMQQAKVLDALFESDTQVESQLHKLLLVRERMGDIK